MGEAGLPSTQPHPDRMQPLQKVKTLVLKCVTTKGKKIMKIKFHKL